MSEPISRREMLRRGGVIAVGLAAPAWLSTIARADVVRQAKGRKIDPNTVLVVCQLSGGNDGLNTVVPYTDPRYRELRPNLGISDKEVLPINAQLGFHPSLAGLAQLYKQGKVAVIQGVGYPKPNRSHFKSMEIWQSGSPETSLKYGWIGRHFDAASAKGKLNPVVALGLSTEKPRALNGRVASIPCFASLADVQSMVGDPDAEKMLRDIQGDAMGDVDRRTVEQANKAAFDAMAALKTKLSTFEPKQTYGPDRFGQGFKQIAQLVATSPQTRVVYFSAGGFDTHAQQATQHAKLLKELGDALLAFQTEMEAVGRADKVMVLVFSEFGRRSFENASGGTDHGAAAPLFLVGKPVKGGLYGPIPDLADLADGDLRYAIDFRQVYATALDDWLGGDSGTVLAGKFDHLSVLK